MKIEGYTVVFNPRCEHAAHAVGLWPFKRIVVGPSFYALTPEERVAILFHEVGHCRGLHMEQRVLALAVVAIPVIAFVPWKIVVAGCASAILWELCAWLARRHEFEADQFARRRGFGQHLARVIYRANQPETSFYPSSATRCQALAQGDSHVRSTP